MSGGQCACGHKRGILLQTLPPVLHRVRQLIGQKLHNVRRRPGRRPTSSARLSSAVILSTGHITCDVIASLLLEDVCTGSGRSSMLTPPHPGFCACHGGALQLTQIHHHGWCLQPPVQVWIVASPSPSSFDRADFIQQLAKVTRLEVILSSIAAGSEVISQNPHEDIAPSISVHMCGAYANTYQCLSRDEVNEVSPRR